MLVSVIIPTYNRAKTIERTVNSVLAQTWKAIEIIVVDDGSTDQTPEVLHRYGDKIRVIRQKNGGPAAARNTGIKAATGDIISFLDSDDLWLPDKTERQMRLIQAGESSGVICCVCSCRMNFVAGPLDSFKYQGLYPAEREGIWTNPADFLVHRFFLFNQVVSVRREALLQAGLFREDLPFGLNDDYDLSVRLSLIGPWSFITDPLVEWYEHPGNISRTHSQLAVCTQTLQILEQINSSPRFRERMPQGRLNQRLWLLSTKIRALGLSNGSNMLSRLLGKSILLYLRGYEAVFRRLPSTHRMITRPL